MFDGGNMSPSFFDVVTHLVIHLVEELIYFGHVANRWCYHVESYLCVLKTYVGNRACPRDQRLQVTLLMKLWASPQHKLRDFPYTTHRIWDMYEDFCNVRLKNFGQRRHLSSVVMRLYQCVARNSTDSTHKFM